MISPLETLVSIPQLAVGFIFVLQRTLPWLSAALLALSVWLFASGDSSPEHIMMAHTLSWSPERRSLLHPNLRPGWACDYA